MSDLEWTNESVIRLIEEYRRRRELWDSSNDLYRVQTAKYEAWSELAKLFDCDIADLRKKLNSIFASHRREKAKVRCGGRSTWFLYSHMKFLPNHLENESNSEIILNPKADSQQAAQDSNDSSSDDDLDNDDHRVQIKQEPVHEYARPSKKVKYSEKTHKRKIKRPIIKKRIVKESDETVSSSLDSKLIEALKLLRRSQQPRKKDECDSFGEYIADSLRKHDERTQSMIKQAINNILFDQEMKKYSAEQYTVVIAGIGDENPLDLGEADASEDK